MRSRGKASRCSPCLASRYHVSIEDHPRGGMALFDAAMLERDAPELAAELARRHDAHHYPGYWRDLVRQVWENAEAELAWSEEDPRRIPVPTLLVMGKADFALSVEQMLSMRRCIPASEMVILNRAGMDGLDNHRVQSTRADVAGPIVRDFLDRHAGRTVLRMSA